MISFFFRLTDFGEKIRRAVDDYLDGGRGEAASLLVLLL
jgi:hypothetical protein